MSKKRLDGTVSCLLIALGILYLVTSISLPQANSGEFSSSVFPSILAIFLIGFSLINLFQVMREKDKKLSFPGMKKNAMTIGILLIYFIIWQFIGYFYIITFFLLLSLFTLYRMPIGVKKPIMITNFFISISLTIFIYVLFSKLMYIAF